MKNGLQTIRRFAVALIAVWAVPAGAVLVQEVNVNPNQVVSISVSGFSSSSGSFSGSVYAGVVNLLVDGKPMSGFCIDPFHFSSSSALQFQYAPLSSGPKVPMGDEKAKLISNLWSIGYADALTNADKAAGLQIAIWEVVGGDNFTLSNPLVDYGAGQLISAAKIYNGPVTPLIALKGPVNGQDYVVAVPDGGSTLILLGTTFLGLMHLRTRREWAPAIL